MNIIRTIAALALVVSLAACSNGESTPATPTETVTETAQPSPEPEAAPADKDEVFLGIVRDEYPDLGYLPDSELIELADLTCGAFDAGASVDAVVNTIIESSNDPAVQESMAFVMGSGVGIYCPEYIEKFETGVAS